MIEPPGDTLSGEGLTEMVYVITCGMCGHTWQRAIAQEGQVVSCIFCGSQGHLRLGVASLERGACGHCRIEAWLHAVGAEER